MIKQTSSTVATKQQAAGHMTEKAEFLVVNLGTATQLTLGNGGNTFEHRHLRHNWPKKQA